MIKIMLILTAILLAACGGSDAVEPQGTGVDGIVIRISSDPTFPDDDLEGAGLALFEAEAFAPILNGADPNTFFAEVDPTAVEAVATTVSDRRGMYSFNAPPGDYVICAAGFNVNQVTTPYDLNGCVPVTIPDGDRLTFDLAVDFGTFTRYNE